MTLQEIRQCCEDYRAAYEAGQMSAEEYRDLLGGLEISKTVTMNAEELQEKEELHKYIGATITILSAV